ncbi:hypothetical protein WJX81_008345 [Elliptochloris bilobata]|uniref:Protein DETOXIFICATION n=1 Tax=Elliptochloris bilobata TaxID=381761 RepID=A0AAW1S731_9CHLO
MYVSEEWVALFFWAFRNGGGSLPEQALREGHAGLSDSALRARLRALHRSNAALSLLLRKLDAQLEAAAAALPKPRRSELARRGAAQPETLRARSGDAGDFHGAIRRRGGKAAGASAARGRVERRVDTGGALAAVVTVTFNRAEYLERHMNSLLDVHTRDRSNRRRFPLFVSQDGAPPHGATRDVARSHPAQITYLSHQQRAAPMVADSRERTAYYRIADHYRFVMRTLFDCFGYSRVIILEDDMELAPDFFGYFAATAPLLDADDSLLCVSSWNDHGQAALVRDATRLLRSDFFPGLGWMLTARLWDELRDKWPQGYWDDWLRLGHVRRERQCIRPEVCRTYNYGERGTSQGQFYRRYLQPIRLNDLDVDWERVDLSYLEKRRFASDFMRALGAARPARNPHAAQMAVGDALLRYTSQSDYERIASFFGMMSDWKDGIPRASYRGVVVVHWQRARVFIAPADASRTQTEVAERGPWELLRFTLPTLGVWVVNPILSLIDTSVVGTRSAVELAALGPGTMLCDYSAYIFTFLAIATTNMLAISFARRNRAAAGDVLSDALGIACVLGCVLAATLYAAAPTALSAIAGEASRDVIAPALSYVRIRCLGVPAALLIFVAQAYFLAAMDPWTPLAAALLAGAANLAGDVALVCWFGWGIAGAALATAAAQLITAGALLAALRRPLRANSLAPGFKVALRWRLPSLRAAGLFLKYAGPIVGVLMSKTVMYSTLTSVASSLGPVNAGAHHVMLSVCMFFFCVGDAVSQAAQSFLPAVIGRPGAAQRLGCQLMTTGVFVGILNCAAAGGLVLVAPRLFTNSSAVVAAMMGLLPLLCVTLVVHTASMATEGMLLAGRDLRFLILSYGGNLALTLACLAAQQRFFAPVTIFGVWWCLLQFQSTRLVQNGWRLTTDRSPLVRERALPGLAPA